jgi:hypothetical protein
MRRVIGILLLLGTALLVDAMLLDGRYRDAVWRDTKQQVQQFNMKVNSWLRKFGL